MSHALVPHVEQLPAAASGVPLVPWRDPHSVSPEDLAGHIARLEQACLEQPRSADIRTCLGMAYAVGFDVYKSMDALELATELDPEHFWAQLKYAELHYRLRLLPRAEEEMLKAVNLARNPIELAIARRQLGEVRTLLRNSTRAVEWIKPLKTPAFVLSVMCGVVFAIMVWS